MFSSFAFVLRLICTLHLPLITASTNATFSALSATAATALVNPARGLTYQQDIYLSDPTTFVSASTIHTNLNPPAGPAMTVLQAMVYLDTAISGSPLQPTDLIALDNMISVIRSAGAKTVLRFAYTASTSTTPTEPPLAGVLQHIAQLTPLMHAASDVLLTVQEGFVGVWGEGYYTTHFGDSGVVNASAQADRDAVTSALLAAVPTPIQLEMRTPAEKQAFLNTSSVSVTAATAFGTSPGARIGHFDDCFLASPEDEGTYREASSEGPDHVYLAAESRYTVRGGETCVPTDASLYACGRALKMLEKEHWTWLHIWNEQYTAAWQQQGCYEEIAARLGYQIAVTGGRWSDGEGDGDGHGHGDIVGWNGMTVANTGFATPMLPYLLEVLFIPQTLVNARSIATKSYSKPPRSHKHAHAPNRNGSSIIDANASNTVAITGYTAILPISTIDLRTWNASSDGGVTVLPDVSFSLPSTSISTSTSIAIANVNIDIDIKLNPATTYELFWNIYDANPAAAKTPAYRIVLANAGADAGETGSVAEWVGKSRLNRLGLTVSGKGLSRTTSRKGSKKGETGKGTGTGKGDVILEEVRFRIGAGGILVW
jgi:predicted nucleic acid-binding Zn ribbon protein